jgi:glycosyltransferase involved in cell wall biosynthesis
MMGTSAPHISVCICTFKRPVLLGRLLAALDKQVTQDQFRYSIVVADNDREESARQGVEAFARDARVPVRYCAEPVQNIALVRNRAVAEADGDWIAFIDDDEVPGEDWLLLLKNAAQEYKADGVLGPVNPYFEAPPPQWVIKGKFFDRPVHPSGYKLSWGQCRTGNVLFDRRILDGEAQPFRPQFATAGEDMDFFRRMIDKGFQFVWCPQAIAMELVPPGRLTRSFLLKRALLRGSNFHKHPSGQVRNALKSIVAVPAYVAVLPIAAIFGQHLFLKYLVKLCDHGSRLLAYAGWSVMKERETL